MKYTDGFIYFLLGQYQQKKLKIKGSVSMIFPSDKSVQQMYTLRKINIKALIVL